VAFKGAKEASATELNENNRARSAKLRTVEKLKEIDL
jgi:16S rRNA C1402 N4-methylase RsmH